MLDLLNLAVTAGALALLAFVVYDFVRAYRAASGTIGQRILAAGNGTETIVVARFTAFVGGFVKLVVEFCGVINQPQVGEALQRVITPTTFGVAMLVVAFTVEWARRRNADL